MKTFLAIALCAATLALLTGVIGVFYLLSALVALQTSIGWNFALTEAWVFRGHSSARRRRDRLLVFFAANNLALALSTPLLFLFVSGARIIATLFRVAFER